MSKLKKLIVLLPLMLLAAATNLWADTKILVHESISFSNGTWGDYWDYNKYYQLLQEDDEIIITPTGSGSFIMSADGSTNTEIKNPFTSGEATTHKLTAAEAASIKANTDNGVSGGIKFVGMGTFTIKVEINFKGRQNDSSLTWSGQELGGFDFSRNPYITIPASYFMGYLTAGNPNNELVIYYIGNSTLADCCFFCDWGGKEWSNSTWNSKGAIRTIDDNGYGAKVAYINIPDGMVDELKAKGLKLLGEKGEGDIVIMGGKIGTNYNGRSAWTNISGLTLSDNVDSKNQGSGTATITYTLNPSNASNKKIHWMSSDTNIATVSVENTDNNSNGTVTVTFLQNENVTITATPWDDRSKTKTITFSKNVTPTYGRERVFINEKTVEVNGKGNTSEVYWIKAEMLQDIQANDVITVTVLDGSDGNADIALKGKTYEHSTYQNQQLVSKGSSISYTIASDKIAELKEDGMRVLVYNKTANETATYKIKATIKRPNEDMFQLPPAGGFNKRPSGGNTMTFNTELFTSETLTKGLYESWNPGLVLDFTYNTSEVNESNLGEHIRIRLARWQNGVATPLEGMEINNLANELSSRSFRYQLNNGTGKVWFQFSNAMLDALYSGAFIQVVGDGKITYTNADYDIENANSDRGWTVAEKVVFTGSPTTGTVGTEVNLSYEVQNNSGTRASMQNVIWSSSDEAMATVDNNGKVTFHGKTGTVVIKALPWDNRTVSDENCTLSIVIKDDITGYDSNTYEVRNITLPKSTENRSYAIHKDVNNKYSESKKVPLIISLHGAWGDWNSGRVNFDYNAQQGTAVVVYPRGQKLWIDFFTNYVRSWDATGEDNGDIEFIEAIIDNMLVDETYGKYIDPTKVYVAGFSNGGMMAYQVAHNLGDKVAAIASTSGYPVNEFHAHHAGIRPVPVMHIHGGADGTVPATSDEGNGYSVYKHIENIVYRNGAGLQAECPTNEQGKIALYNNMDKTTITDATRTTKFYHATGADAADVKFVFIDKMGHDENTGYGSVDGTSNYDIRQEMTSFFNNYTLPTPTPTDDNKSGYSPLKFRALWGENSSPSAQGMYGIYVPNGTIIGDNNQEQPTNLLVLYAGDKNTHNVTGTSGDNHNVYYSLQFQARDNNGDHRVEGLHKMHIKASTTTTAASLSSPEDIPHISVRLTNIRTGQNALFKRYALFTYTKTITTDEATHQSTTTYTYTPIGNDIYINFNVPEGWDEYRLQIDRGELTDNVKIDGFEFYSGKYADPTPEAVYTPDDIPGIGGLNLVYQPRFETYNDGVAKEYFAIGNIYKRGERNGEEELIYMQSTWKDVTINDQATFESDYKGKAEKRTFTSLPTHSNTEGTCLADDQPYYESSDEDKKFAHIFGNNAYHVDYERGVCFSEYGCAGMVKYLNDKASEANAASAQFPTKGMLLMKLAGTMDVTLLAENVGANARTVNVYYMNDRTNETPVLLKSFHFKGYYDEVPTRDEEYAGTHTNDNEGGYPLAVAIRLEQLGKDGTCTLIYTYEGGVAGGEPNPSDNDKSNEVWVRGFLIKRPDLKVTVGRTDTKYYPSGSFNNGDRYHGDVRCTVFGPNEPYVWSFDNAGFTGMETFNKNDDRTYICGYKHPNDIWDEDRMHDHLLVYSQNKDINVTVKNENGQDQLYTYTDVSIAHFNGLVPGRETIQFDAPTQYADAGDGTSRDLFNPITNDGIKLNVTGSGWFKVWVTAPYLPDGLEACKMKVWISRNGGQEHISLVREFDIPITTYTNNQPNWTECTSFIKAVLNPLKDVKKDADGNVYGIDGNFVGKMVNGNLKLDEGKKMSDVKYLDPETLQQSIYVTFSMKTRDEYGYQDWAGDEDRRKTFQVNLHKMSWLNDDVPDYVFQNESYMFRNKYDNDEINDDEHPETGHMAYKYLKKRQTVYRKNSDGKQDKNLGTMIYWQAGGAEANGLGGALEGENRDEYAYNAKKGTDNPTGVAPHKGSLYLNGSSSPRTDFIAKWEYSAQPTQGIVKAAHTEMQSPRVYQGIKPTTNEFKFTGTEEFAGTETNEFNLPISGPFFRFMPMKNTKVTAYVVTGGAGTIYVVDESGKLLNNNSTGSKDWKVRGTIITPTVTDGVYTATAGNTVKIEMDLRAGKEYFLCSKGMAIGMAAMYFDEIGLDQIDKRGTYTVSEDGDTPAVPDTDKLIDESNCSGVNTTILSAADDNNGKYVDVNINRTFAQGKWYSLVLPFSMNEEKFKEVFGEDAKCIHFEAVSGKNVYLLHHRYNMIVAGRPIFIKTGTEMELVSGKPKTVTDVTLQLHTPGNNESFKSAGYNNSNGVDITGYKSGDYAFVCSYKPVNMKAESLVMSTKTPNNAYAGQIAYMEKPQATKGLRAWIQPTGGGGLAKLSFASYDYSGELLDENELNGIEKIFEEDNNEIMFVNMSDKVYDLNGRVVATGADMGALPAGIYIVNGKKFVK